MTVEEHFKYNLENDPIWTWNIKLSTQFNEKFSQFLEKMSTEYFEERRAETVKLLLDMFRKMKLYLIVRLRYWSEILGYTSKFFEVTDFVHQWAPRFTKRKLDKRVTRGLKVNFESRKKRTLTKCLQDDLTTQERYALHKTWYHNTKRDGAEGNTIYPKQNQIEQLAVVNSTVDHHQIYIQRLRAVVLWCIPDKLKSLAFQSKYLRWGKCSSVPPSREGTYRM